jgi:hypothetical protein
MIALPAGKFRTPIKHFFPAPPGKNSFSRRESFSRQANSWSTVLVVNSLLKAY